MPYLLAIIPGLVDVDCSSCRSITETSESAIQFRKYKIKLAASCKNKHTLLGSPKRRRAAAAPAQVKQQQQQHCRHYGPNPTILNTPYSPHTHMHTLTHSQDPFIQETHPQLGRVTVGLVHLCTPFCERADLVGPFHGLIDRVARASESMPFHS